MPYNTLSSLVGKHVAQAHKPIAANTPAVGCSLNDATFGDEGWKCLCRETDFRMKLEESTTLRGDVVNYMIINATLMIDLRILDLQMIFSFLQNQGSNW